MIVIGLDKIQEIETDIVHEVCKICEEENIPYYLEAGTALGAVRHGGPIPWDNDADIGIPHEDIDRFCNAATMKLSKKYYVDYYKINKRSASTHPDVFAHGVDGRSCHVDIFPYIGVPDDKNTAMQHYKSIQENINILSTRRFNYIGRRDDQSLRMIIKRGMHYLRCFIKNMKAPTDKILSKTLDSLYNAYPLVTSNYIMDPCSEYGEREIMKKNWLGMGIKVKYGGRMLKVYEKYDKYLSQLYGDYMTPPPQESVAEQFNVKARINVHEYEKYFGIKDRKYYEKK